MSATQGENRAAAEIARLRKDGDAGGTSMGYDNEGRVVEVKGDDQAPFGKQPPFPTSRDLLLEVDVLSVDSYTPSEEIDVEKVHILTVWVDYTPGDDGAILSLIPQVRDSREVDFEPTSVLSAAITEVNLPGETGIYGSRPFYQTELRTPAMQAGNTLCVPLSFDVGPYKQFRMRAGEIGNQTGGRLLLSASKSD